MLLLHLSHLINQHIYPIAPLFCSLLGAQTVFSSIVSFSFWEKVKYKISSSSAEGLRETCHFSAGLGCGPVEKRSVVYHGDHSLCHRQRPTLHLSINAFVSSDTCISFLVRHFRIVFTSMFISLVFSFTDESWPQESKSNRIVRYWKIHTPSVVEMLQILHKLSEGRLST